MTYQLGQPFSTYDNGKGYCAVQGHGAWWYNGCQWSNINGLYGGSGLMGVNWYPWDYGLQTTAMKMRPAV